MLKYFVLIALSATSLLQGQEKNRAELKPIDLQGGPSGFYLSGISQIESNGRHLYLRGNKDTEILVTTPAGKLVKRIGGKGGHPGEFGDFGVLAMAVHGDRLWAIDMDRRRVRLFEGGIYRHSFRLPSYNKNYFAITSNVFACSEDRIVVPADPSTKHLASLFAGDGALVKQVGALLPFTDELAERVPGINDSFWLHEDGAWYSIHKFMPVVTRYDSDFRLVTQFQIDTPETHQYLDSLYSLGPGPPIDAPLALINDAKIHGGDLYLMINGRLHDVDLGSGEVRSVTSFYGTGPDFADVDTPYVTLFSFAFVAEDQLVLAHPAMPWNHDLWAARLPK